MSAQTVNIPQGGAGFDDTLQDALRQCLLLSDYDQATARWYLFCIANNAATSICVVIHAIVEQGSAYRYADYVNGWASAR